MGCVRERHSENAEDELGKNKALLRCLPTQRTELTRNEQDLYGGNWGTQPKSKLLKALFPLKSWSLEVIHSSPFLIYTSATYILVLRGPIYLPLPTKDVFSPACFTLQCQAWSLPGFILLPLIHWEDEHRIFRIHFICIFTSLHLQALIHVFMKAHNTRGACKLQILLRIL